MARWLFPRAGNPHLALDVIEDRLRKAFRYVEADPNAGAEINAGKLRHLQRLGPVPQELVEQYQTAPGGTRFLVSDVDLGGTAAFLESMAARHGPTWEIPDVLARVAEAICISFLATAGKDFPVRFYNISNPEDQDRAVDISMRCAEALGYEFVDDDDL